MIVCVRACVCVCVCVCACACACVCARYIEIRSVSVSFPLYVQDFGTLKREFRVFYVKLPIGEVVHEMVRMYYKLVVTYVYTYVGTYVCRYVHVCARGYRYVCT